MNGACVAVVRRDRIASNKFNAYVNIALHARNNAGLRDLDLFSGHVVAAELRPPKTTKVLLRESLEKTNCHCVCEARHFEDLTLEQNFP